MSHEYFRAKTDFGSFTVKITGKTLIPSSAEFKNTINDCGALPRNHYNDLNSSLGGTISLTPKVSDIINPGAIAPGLTSARAYNKHAAVEPSARMNKSNADPSAPQDAQNPPDAPATLLKLVIRIPVRRFPPANAKEKDMSFKRIRSYMYLIQNTSNLSLRTYYFTELFVEMARQPITVAQSRIFRNTIIHKIPEIEKEVYTTEYTDHTDALEDAIQEMHLMLADIHHHPWYIE